MGRGRSRTRTKESKYTEHVGPLFEYLAMDWDRARSKRRRTPPYVCRPTLSCICHYLAVVGKTLDTLYKEGTGALESRDRLMFLFLFQQAVDRRGIVCLSGQSVCMRAAIRRDRGPHLGGDGTMYNGHVVSYVFRDWTRAFLSTRTVSSSPSIMPVTRSSSRQTSQQPSNLLYSSRRAGPSSGSGGTKKTPKSPSNEIIVLSSDDDEPPSKGTVLSKKSSSRTTKRKPAAFAAPPVLSVDVLEISSDDESKPKKSSTRKKAQSSGTTNKDLERTIKKLQEVCLATCIPFRSAGVDSE